MLFKSMAAFKLHFNWFRRNFSYGNLAAKGHYPLKKMKRTNIALLWEVKKETLP